MKLRTSFFNPTVFKKDLTRFAPTWVLYSVGLFMVLAAVMSNTYSYHSARNLADTTVFFAFINLGYGLLNGQLLFGDLFSARHCNALHAMPLRRECWFVTHTVSGLAFAFVPNLVMALIAAPMLENGWPVAFFWLLAVNLQYLFFFGLAVLSALCVGNRFAMALVYGIINFFSLIIYWFYYSIYEPLLYGVQCDESIFTRFCPMWTMVELDELIVAQGKEGFSNYTVESVSLGDGWGYMAVCAALGVAMLGLALMLYRRRKLESAGDFMAVRPLEPVFLGLYTMSMSAFFQAFAQLFDLPEYLFLGLGLVIGFFTGRMLLKRTIRVFQPRAILACFLSGLVFAASLVLTVIDPIGITRYVPEADQVAGVYLDTYLYRDMYEDKICFEDPGDIEKLIRVHELILADEIYDAQRNPEDDYAVTSLCIAYELKDGRTIQRYYHNIQENSPAAEAAREFFSRTAYIIGGDPAEMFESLNYVHFSSYEKDYYGELPADIGRGLLEAIVADCEMGTMTQQYVFRNEDVAVIGAVAFQWSYDSQMDYYNYQNIDIFENSANTVAYINEKVIPWLEANQYG